MAKLNKQKNSERLEKSLYGIIVPGDRCLSLITFMFDIFYMVLGEEVMTGFSQIKDLSYQNENLQSNKLSFFASVILVCIHVCIVMESVCNLYFYSHRR